MSLMRESRGVRKFSATAAILLAIVAWPGCGRDERGPELLGGREVKSWVADLHHPRPQVRRLAVVKLGNVGDAEPAVAAGLVEALNDPDALVRRDAILAVARLKDLSPAVKQRLETMSRSDKDARARDLARKAVIRLGGDE
jgi:HEAT repeat protein